MFLCVHLNCFTFKTFDRAPSFKLYIIMQARQLAAPLGVFGLVVHLGFNIVFSRCEMFIVSRNGNKNGPY